MDSHALLYQHTMSVNPSGARVRANMPDGFFYLVSSINVLFPRPLQVKMFKNGTIQLLKKINCSCDLKELYSLKLAKQALTHPMVDDRDVVYPERFDGCYALICH